MELVIGRIYKSKTSNKLFRIFKSGGSKWFSGRGCTPKTAIPQNYITAEDYTEPTIDEINFFLEEEMKNGMAQTINRKS